MSSIIGNDNWDIEWAEVEVALYKKKNFQVNGVQDFHTSMVEQMNGNNTQKALITLGKVNTLWERYYINEFWWFFFF